MTATQTTQTRRALTDLDLLIVEILRGLPIEERKEILKQVEQATTESGE